MSQEAITSFLIGLVGAAIGGLIEHFFQRRQSKLTWKMESRTKAYEEFIVFLLSRDDGPLLPKELRVWRSILGRLGLFGEDCVVKAVSKFVVVWAEHKCTIAAPSVRAPLLDVISSMRDSLITNFDEATRHACSSLIDMRNR